AVDQIASMLPEDVDPQVMSMSVDMMPAVLMAISTPDGDEAAMASTVESVLIAGLGTVPGVRSADLTGVAEDRVEIDLDEDELEDAAITPQDVSDALGASGLLQAGGSIDKDGRTLSVTTGQQHTSLEQIEDVWVQPAQGADPSDQ